jgi:hypothetical protein
MPTLHKTIRVRRAGSIGTHEPDSITIEIDRQIEDNMTLDGARTIYEVEAMGIGDALIASLPGGTLDQLLAYLMVKRASLFRVPLFDKEEA